MYETCYNLTCNKLYSETFAIENIYQSKILYINDFNVLTV